MRNRWWDGFFYYRLVYYKTICTNDYYYYSTIRTTFYNNPLIYFYCEIKLHFNRNPLNKIDKTTKHRITLQKNKNSWFEGKKIFLKITFYFRAIGQFSDINPVELIEYKTYELSFKTSTRELCTFNASWNWHFDKYDYAFLQIWLNQLF